MGLKRSKGAQCECHSFASLSAAALLAKGAYSLTHSLTHLLTHALAHSLTRSLTHSQSLGFRVNGVQFRVWGLLCRVERSKGEKCLRHSFASPSAGGRCFGFGLQD